MVRGDFEKSWHARYENWASKYKDDHLIAGWSAEGLSRRLALVLSLIKDLSLKPGSLVLDLGAGAGTYTRAISNIGHTCLGLDYSKRVIEAAKEKGKGEHYIQGEAYNLPFRANVFDAVVCIGVLQSLKDPEYALGEMQRVLMPGGHLFLDGLSRIFWLHRFRSWKEALNGENARMNYVNPYRLRRGAESMGFSDGKLYWLGVTKLSPEWIVDSKGFVPFLFAHLAGHAFLLYERKSSLEELPA